MTDIDKIKTDIRSLAQAMNAICDVVNIRANPEIIEIASRFNSPISSDSSPDTSWVPDYFKLILHEGKPRLPLIGEWCVRQCVGNSFYCLLFTSPFIKYLQTFAVHSPPGAIAFRAPRQKEWLQEADDTIFRSNNGAPNPKSIFGIGRRRWIIDTEQREIALAMEGK